MAQLIARADQPNLVLDRFLQVAVGNPRASQTMPLGEGRRGLFPALAIPVERKRTFECPDEHLVALRRDIPRLTKLVLIGWRATEQHFLDLLAEALQGKPIEILSACGNTDESAAAWERVAARVTPLVNRPDRGITGLGFTDLIRHGTFEEFIAPRP
jgi:hypothetical protein